MTTRWDVATTANLLTPADFIYLTDGPRAGETVQARAHGNSASQSGIIGGNGIVKVPRAASTAGARSDRTRRAEVSTLRVPLANGKGFAVIDATDWPLVSRYEWHSHTRRDGQGFYAATRGAHGRANRYLHRLILDAPRGINVDHKNGDGLDCRRVNLRLCDQTLNNANQRLSCMNTSGYKGVSLTSNPTPRWFAQIKRRKQHYFLGTFGTPEDAAHAYDAKARELFGEFARVNFPAEGEQGAR